MDFLRKASKHCPMPHPSANTKLLSLSRQKLNILKTEYVIYLTQNHLYLVLHAKTRFSSCKAHFICGKHFYHRRSCFVSHKPNVSVLNNTDIRVEPKIFLGWKPVVSNSVILGLVSKPRRV